MPKILYLVSEDWFFVSHFLPLVKAARACALDVVVATRVDRQRPVLEAAGCRVVTLPIQRSRLGPLALLREIAAIGALLRREQPDVVHCIALRMVILGGIASVQARSGSLVLAVTGLGTLWVNADVKSAAGRGLVRWVIRRLVGRGAHVVFENTDDPHEFGLDPDAAAVTILPGAGVDPAKFPPVPEPATPPVKFAVVSRMLRTKGIAQAVETVRQVRAAGAAVELHLFGDPDPTNRESCTATELRAWAAEPGIAWHGRTGDVAQVWRDHHAALLLTSYREGLPRTLVEAAASGRPIVATDVPGCREIVRDGIDGFLVDAASIDGAIAAVRRLAADDTLRRRMGGAARERFLAGFTEDHVRQAIEALYRRLLGR
jgi:glycosyltransferase involved in cell wall biosynthesis